MTASEADAAARNAQARLPKITRAESRARDVAALTEGAWSLRYCAERLADMNGAGDPEVARSRVARLRVCAERLTRMADRVR